MKRLLVATAISLLILAFTATAALAHGRHAVQDLGCREQDCAQVTGNRRDHFEEYRFGQGARFDPSDPAVGMAHPAVPETITGSVMDVYQTASKRGQGTGLHLRLKTDEGMLDVHLGPEWYLEQQDFRIEPGDSLEITGDRFRKDGMPALIAFDDEAGRPSLELARSRWISAMEEPPPGLKQPGHRNCSQS